MKIYFMILIMLWSWSSLADTEIRIGGAAGLMGGNYSESFSGASANVTLQKSIALEPLFGLSHGNFYAAYAPVFKTRGVKAHSASYTSLLGFEAGWSGLGVDLPLDVFAGIEYGELAFSKGTKTELSGMGYKIGADVFPFHLNESTHMGLRLEYKTHSMKIDSYNGPEINTSLSTYFLGVVLMFSTPPAKTENPI